MCRGAMDDNRLQRKEIDSRMCCSKQSQRVDDDLGHIRENRLYIYEEVESSSSSMVDTRAPISVSMPAERGDGKSTSI